MYEKNSWVSVFLGPQALGFQKEDDHYMEGGMGIEWLFALLVRLNKQSVLRLTLEIWMPYNSSCVAGLEIDCAVFTHTKNMTTLPGGSILLNVVCFLF